MRRAGKRVAMLQISHKTNRFLLNISQRLEQFMKEGISQDSLEKNSVSQEWTIFLKNHIEESTDQEISEEIKEELQYLIHHFTNNNKLLIMRLKEHNLRFDDFFKELKSSLAIYKEYKSRKYEKSLIPEGKRVAKKIAHQLVEIKKNYILQQIFNENNPDFQNLKEILKENLYNNTVLNLKEKSTIIKIIRNDKLCEEDKTKLISVLSKLPTKDLISFLGEDFKKHTQNYVGLFCDNKKQQVDSESFENDLTNQNSIKSNKPIDGNLSCSKHLQNAGESGVWNNELDFNFCGSPTKDGIGDDDANTKYPSPKLDGFKYIEKKLNLNEKNVLMTAEDNTHELKQSKSRKIKFDNDYYEKLEINFDIITNHLSIKTENKKIIREKALEIFNSALENGLKPSDLEIRNAGVLSIVFIYFSLLFYDYTKIKNNALTYGTICRSLGQDLQIIGVSNCKSRNLGIVSKFLPENLRAKYKEFYSKRLYTGRFTFEEFINFIKRLGLKKTGIVGKALSPKFNYDKLSINDYQELTLEEYYDLIENKKGTEVRIPVWCGRYGHTPWEGILSNLLQEKWCRECADEKKITFSLERLKEIARKRGREETGVEGKILDSQKGDKELTQDTYDRLTDKKAPGKTHFWWSCRIKGHPPWKTIPSHIFKDKTWCPICKMGLYTHSELLKLAKIRGREETGVEGKILDSKNCDKELTLETYNRLTVNKKTSEVSFWWSCENGHPPFKNSPPNIRRGQWCPICSHAEGKFEKIIRDQFEKVFRVYFPEEYLRDLNLKYTEMDIDLDLSKEKEKIKFMRYKVNFCNPGRFRIYDGKMRFDGYAEFAINGKLIKIAFEYNGIQHYEFPNFWFGDSTDGFQSWLKYIERDQIKKEICKLNNIYLIEIPYYIDRALEHPEKIRSYIINQFELITGIKLY